MVDLRKQYAHINKEINAFARELNGVTIEDAPDNDVTPYKRNHRASPMPREGYVKTVVTPTEFTSEISVTPSLPSLTRSSDITTNNLFDDSVTTIPSDFSITPYTPRLTSDAGPKSIDTSPTPISMVTSRMYKTPSTTSGTTSITKTSAETEECHFYEPKLEKPYSCKERAFLKYQYDIPMVKPPREFSACDTKKPPKVAINKACQLRIACARHITYNSSRARNLKGVGGYDPKEHFELHIIPPRPAPKDEPYSVPFRNNRTTKLRYMYNHLPTVLRSRFGIFEDLTSDSPDKQYRSKDPLTGEITYVIENIKYEPLGTFADKDRKLEAKPPKPTSQRSQPSSLQQTTANISAKRAKELQLRQKRAERIEREKRLPFRV